MVVDKKLKIRHSRNLRKKHFAGDDRRERFRNDRPIFGNWRIVRNEPKVARAIRVATGSALVMQVDLKTR